VCETLSYKKPHCAVFLGVIHKRCLNAMKLEVFKRPSQRKLYGFTSVALALVAFRDNDPNICFLCCILRGGSGDIHEANWFVFIGNVLLCRVNEIAGCLGLKLPPQHHDGAQQAVFGEIDQVWYRRLHRLYCAICEFVPENVEKSTLAVAEVEWRESHIL
jgi:hypothetical protein